MRFINLFFLFLMMFTSPLLSQTQHYRGTWTKINTTYQFDFELTLIINKSNQVEGHFLWTIVQFDENNNLSKKHYEEKLNMTAKEFVKGTFYPTRGEYTLKGYKKDDPHNIIGIDVYNLKIDKDGNLGGTTNSNGTWLGRINGQQVLKEVL